ncbi:hypothetical protein D3C81_1793640 [compost metagenome]
MLLDQHRVGFDGGRAFHARVFHTINQRDHCAAHDHGTDGGQHGHRPAAQGRHHVLLRGHRHHHGNIHGAPVFDAPLRHLRQPAAPLHVETGADQQQHGDAHAAHVGLDAHQLPEQVAQEDAEQMA